MPPPSADRPVLEDVTSRANELPSQPAQLQTGTKRKATDAPTAINFDDINLDGMLMDASCNQVRAKIRRFLDSGEMKKGAFANALGVSSKSLNDFLGRSKNPMDGSGSATYGAAWEFFTKREMAGIKVPSAKRKKPTASAAPVPPIDLGGIALSGEASDSVRVYDSCDEVRKKINAHLVKSSVTQAQFCRDLSSQVHTEARKIQSKQLTDFRSKNGPTSGNTSIVYYTAYCYFEKLRLAEGRPKSQHRLGMEKTWPEGADTDNVSNYFTCVRGSRPVMDSFGSVKIV